ncbi:chromosome partitioning protein [Bathymodiolus platifrons methanotrophic gill symbiont]|uniref:AAA family ATPase n=1 Tax=Bathymodiolus platifrons methanotrophic gill symbiont TaxID=113268 RepID=UPI001B3E486A|nr:AAA family ATPase [Bathymodiolus platifrons methanotrophic gill symbiont]GFO77150.1 chromosome partitioning protein [Bathymodiolus platifrons methanotrophic gill symbiont]
MDVWFLVCSKGGVGKSTISTNMAVCAARAGKKVLLVDLDEKQKSAANWWKRREIEDDIKAVTVPHDIEKVKEIYGFAQKQGYDLVIFDTKGASDTLHNVIIGFATLCIVPVQPSVFDLEAIPSTANMIKSLDKPFTILVSRCPPVGNEFEKLRLGLAAHGLVCPYSTVERKVYRHAAGLGLGAGEYDEKDKAAEEVKNIYDWLVKTEKKQNSLKVAS